MNQKVNTWLAFGLIAALAIAVGVLARSGKEAMKNKNIGEMAKNSTADKYSDWKVYSSKNFKFSFRYPAKYKLNSVDYTDSADLKKNNIDQDALVKLPQKASEKTTLLSVSSAPSGTVLSESDSTAGFFAIDIYKTNRATIDDYFSAWRKDFERPSSYEGIRVNPKIKSVKDTTAGGRKAKLYATGYQFPFSDTGMVVLNDGYIYNFSFLYGKDEDEVVKKNREIFEQIISTVQFVK